MNPTYSGGIVLAVVVVAILLYVMDRKGKGAPIEGSLLFKIASFSGLVTGGVVFALQADGIPEAIESVSEVAQDMFVGQPTF